MPPIEVNGLQLFYEATGDPANPPLLLIAGLGVQLTGLPDDFVGLLVDHGLYVIRFDNRDIGLSTSFEGGQDNVHAVLGAVLAGEEPEVAYTMADMADDAAGLLRALGIPSAHVAGVSMGGMIAQEMAIRYPELVRSLSSIMSSTGARGFGEPTAEAIEAILSAAPGTDRAEIIAHNVRTAKVWASPDHFDAVEVEARFQHSWDRAGGPQSRNGARQFCAILASPDRDNALSTLDVPTLVIHGTADALVAASGGQRTADVIPGAMLLTIDGMGHDLTPAFLPDIVHAITALIDDTIAG